MSSEKRQYDTVVSQAKKGVPGFASAYAKFIEKTTLQQSSRGLITNYSRSLAYVALHFGRLPHQISVEEINAYLYSMMVHEKCRSLILNMRCLHCGIGFGCLIWKTKPFRCRR